MTDVSGVDTPAHLEHRFTLADGRTFAMAEWGDPDGLPIVQIHGTPGGRISYWEDLTIYARHGLRRFTVDRAGYGESTRKPGRSVVDFVDDVAQAMDQLGIDRFVVSGGSGGGPHALALAACLPDRVIRCMASVSVAPYGPDGLEHDDWTAGLTHGNVLEFGAGLQGEAASRALLEPQWAESEARLRGGRSDWMGDGYDLSDADLESERKHIARIKDQLLNGLVHGVDGWIDDNIAMTRPWGFSVEDIRVPVVLVYGRTDVLVPPAHGDWLAAHVPGAEAWVDDVAGHFGNDDEIEREFAWLAQPDPRA